MRRRSPEHQALGVAIREHRERIGISQEELGYVAHMHRTYVGGLERGERNPTVAKVFALAAALGVTASALFARGESLAAGDGGGPRTGDE